MPREPRFPGAVPGARKGGSLKRPVWGILVAIVIAAGTALIVDNVLNTGNSSYSATAGPSCNAGTAGPSFYTSGPSNSGGWANLPGSAVDGCGDALTHLTIDKQGGANWVFTPGVGAICTFDIHIPNSDKITAIHATYQAWETVPDYHQDPDRIETNTYVDQEAHRGGVIPIKFGPTKTRIMDLQLYDDNSRRTVEVAGVVTATCHIP